MPKISVIMPAYNAEKYIGQAIESILNQSFSDFEFIILNDCSKDGTESVILSYGDERIVYVKNEENLGVARTLNKGLALARGEYIARMDADDISLPERFAKQAVFLDSHANVAVVGVGVTVFDESGDVQTRFFSEDPGQMHVDMLFACGLAHPGVMYRREEVLAMDGYDPAYNGLEDYELWDRMMEQWDICALPFVGLRYRLHGGQVTQNLSPRHEALLRSLKQRQLQRLGLDTAAPGLETFLALCAGRDAYPVRELAAFLDAVVQANRKAGVYAQAVLEKICRSLVLSRLQSRQCREALAAVKGFRVVTPLDVAAYRAKQTVKRLLGR